jgi:cytochrome c oxidase assembly factor CtaG
VPVTVLLAVLLSGYSIGAWRIHERSASRSWLFKRSCFLAAGLSSLWFALASPLEDYADILLTAHMVQHLILMLVAAPLLVLARPMGPFLWALPLSIRGLLGGVWNGAGLSRLVRLARKPPFAWIAFCGSIVLWHVPAVFRWAQAMEPAHVLMHASLLGASLLFWSVVLGEPQAPRLGVAAKSLYVLCAALVTGLPGALIAFAPRPLYSSASAARPPFGLTALTDQQLAGLVMWIPMDLMLFAVSLALFAAALGAGRGGAFVHDGTRHVLDRPR